jgi:cytokinesis protein
MLFITLFYFLFALGSPSDTDGSPGEKGMMDSLLETLRKGGDGEATRSKDRKRRQQRAQNAASVAVRAQDLLTSLREDSTDTGMQ